MLVLSLFQLIRRGLTKNDKSAKINKHELSCKPKEDQVYLLFRGAADNA